VEKERLQVLIGEIKVLYINGQEELSGGHNRKGVMTNSKEVCRLTFRRNCQGTELNPVREQVL
jgi:hypothetical protein